MVVKKLPRPQNDCGLIIWGSPFKQNEKQTIGKVDYQLNASHSLMGRVMVTSLDKPVPYELSPDNMLQQAAARSGPNPIRSATPGL